jgi:hypothetical protein
MADSNPNKSKASGSGKDTHNCGNKNCRGLTTVFFGPDGKLWEINPPSDTGHQWRDDPKIIEAIIAMALTGHEVLLNKKEHGKNN